jgi:hypothetical protein
VSVLRERMKKEIEEKGMVPDSQTEFRKVRGTMDNMYILGHLAKSEVKKATFDKVDTEKMFECMRERSKRMAGAEGQGDIRENEKQGEGGKERE